jgi:hypothetical protein
MRNIKALVLTIQKLYPRLKVLADDRRRMTERLNDRQDKNLRSRGHRNIYKKKNITLEKFDL